MKLQTDMIQSFKMYKEQSSGAMGKTMVEPGMAKTNIQKNEENVLY